MFSLANIAIVRDSLRPLHEPEDAALSVAIPRGGVTHATRARISQDSESSYIGGALTQLAPLASEHYALGTMDTKYLERMPPAKLLEVLADISPDISRALWDFLRFCNPGWDKTVLRVSGSSAAPKAAQQALDSFLDRLADNYGSVDIPINRLFLAGFLRGGFCAELVLDKRGRTPVDLATPDPATIKFRRVNDRDRGPIWQPFQWQAGEAVALDRETIRYIPIDPMPGRPEGRAPAAPALFPALFLIALLHDLRRVVQQQGYPRIDVSIDLEALQAAMPQQTKTDYAQYKAFVEAAYTQVQSAYANLRPDDAYIHTSDISVNRPVGAVDSSSLGAVDGLISAIERQTVRALKSMPLLMGTSEGSTTDTAAIRQWELHAAAIKSIQHPVETMLSQLLTLALQVQGVAGVVEFRFSELRASEMLRDAQTDALLIANAKNRYLAGWISQDEAAMQGANKDKADVPEPRDVGATMAIGSIASANPEPGSIQ